MEKDFDRWNETKKTTDAADEAARLYFREGKEDYWLNIGVAFPHKDGSGFTIKLQAFPLDGKIVCREITADEEADDPVPEARTKQVPGRAQGGQRR